MLSTEELRSGRRYFVLGQKGTGKTAILRKLQIDGAANGEKSQFLIFRDEVASREELDKLGRVFAVKINDVKSTHHYFYTLERLLLLALASKLSSISVDDESVGDEETKSQLRQMFSRVIGQPIKRIVDVAIETSDIVASTATLDPAKLSKGLVEVDNNILLRKLNEKILASCVSALRKSSQKVAIYIDEIHFVYRTGADHDQDAALVRDLIRAVNRLNRELRSEAVQGRFVAALRSEFLEHPLISAAELHPVLQGFGVELNWSTFSANLEHPMFEIGARRVEASTKGIISGKGFMKARFANFNQQDAVDFVQSTWSKPRDMIRFLRTCKKMFGSKVSLSRQEYAQVFHQSCFSARKEVETALTSFLTMQGIGKLTDLFSKYSSISLEKGSFCSTAEIYKLLQPIVRAETQVGAIGTPESLFRILYMLGAFYTVRKLPNGSTILHSYHRGQVNPDLEGRVAIHRAIAKSFS